MLLPDVERKHNKNVNSAEFFSLIFVTWTTYLGFYFVQPMMTTLAQVFKISPSQAGLLVTVVVVPFVIGPFVYGRVLHFISIRRLLFLLIPCSGISLIAASFASSYVGLLCCRLLQGVSLPGILMCITAHIALRYEGQTLQRCMGIYAATTLIGSFSGRLMGGWLSSAYGWHSAFQCLGAVQIVSFLTVCFLIGEVREKIGHDDFGLRDIAKVLRCRLLMLLILIPPVAGYCVASYVAVLPFYLKDIDPEMSDACIGLIYLSGLISGIVGLWCRQVVRWCRGEWNVIMFSLLCMALLIQGLAFKHAGIAFILMLGISLSFTLINCMVPGLLNRASRLSKGLTNSVYLSIYYLAGAVGTYMPLVVYTHFGLGIYDMTVLIALSSALAITLSAKKSFHTAG
ncbi:MAG: MFS transporter [Desulfovibrionaceae bacterium]|nr:MFS transporter [Desulfovibrionaceae bacterium]